MALYKHRAPESIDSFALLSQISSADVSSVQHLLHETRNL